MVVAIDREPDDNMVPANEWPEAMGFWGALAGDRAEGEAHALEQRLTCPLLADP